MQPETFGKYTLLSRLGSGGMAEVFMARAVSIGGFEKLLAIKRLLPCYTQEPETIALLGDEARITVRLTHPNIVQIFDFGRVDDSYYIAMEYVDGLDLKTLIRIDDSRSSMLPLPVALHIAISALDGLEFAHQQTDERGSPLGIIHRDVSPHNVLISRHGQIKLTDFGVARAAISSHVSYAGDIRGKFSYMPPEQVCGETIDQRVDIFAAGAVLFELLAGFQPYRSSNIGEQVALLNAPVEPPSDYRPEIPPSLDAICLRAMAKDARQRFATAGAFSRALREQSLQLFGPAPPPIEQLARLVDEKIHATAKMPSVMSIADYSLPENSLIAGEISAVQARLRVRGASEGPPEPSLVLRPVRSLSSYFISHTQGSVSSLAEEEEPTTVAPRVSWAEAEGEPPDPTDLRATLVADDHRSMTTEERPGSWAISGVTGKEEEDLQRPRASPTSSRRGSYRLLTFIVVLVIAFSLGILLAILVATI